jgi:hypothetical protein
MSLYVQAQAVNYLGLPRLEQAAERVQAEAQWS